MTSFIKKWSLPLRWWLLFSVLCIVMFVLINTSVLSSVWAVDWTKISYLIYTVFFIFTVRTGLMAYRMSDKGEFFYQDDYNDFCRKNKVSWFVADQLLTLGMIGTVLGFIYLLSGVFTGISALSPSEIQSILSKMTSGMSVALYTTASGLICSLLLKIQLIDFEQHLDKTAESCGCELNES